MGVAFGQLAGVEGPHVGDLADDLARRPRGRVVVRADQHVALDRLARGRPAPWPARGGRRRPPCECGHARPARWRPPSPGAAPAAGTPCRRLVRALAIEMTTLPRSWSATDTAVWRRRRPTAWRSRPRRLSAAPALSAASMDRLAVRPAAPAGCRPPPWPGTSTGTRRPRRSPPTPGGRPAPCPPGPFHPGCRCARRQPTGAPGTGQPAHRGRRGRRPATAPGGRGPGQVPFPPRACPGVPSRHGQQTEATSGYGLTAPPPPGWYSKCRWGVPAALPESPT